MQRRSLLLLALAFRVSALAADPPEPKFLDVTLDRTVQIGYGLAIADVDGDQFPDILLADKKQFVWYQNPGPSKAGDLTAWHKHLLAENLTPKDNVCIAAQDIDGDGKCEIAVGAEWNPSDTENSGAVFYLIPPADRTQLWPPVKLHAEPTVHRMKWVRGRESKWCLVVVPLHGHGNKNGEGEGVKILAYTPPPDLQDPKGEWKTEQMNQGMDLHMTHNLDVQLYDDVDGSGHVVTVGAKEGLYRFACMPVPSPTPPGEVVTFSWSGLGPLLGNFEKLGFSGPRIRPLTLSINHPGPISLEDPAGLLAKCRGIGEIRV